MSRTKGIFLFLFFFLFTLSTDSRPVSKMDRLAQGEVILEKNATGFQGDFYLFADPKKVWRTLLEIENWKVLSSLILSSHAISVKGIEDRQTSTMISKQRMVYLKCLYRGKMLRLFLEAKLQGQNLEGKKKTQAEGGKKPVVSSFRGGSLYLSGPVESISGTPFVLLKDFARLRLQLRTGRIRQKRGWKLVTHVSFLLQLDYSRLFLADRAINLFPFDYRSSEFDRQVELGVKKLVSDLRSYFQNGKGK